MKGKAGKNDVLVPFYRNGGAYEVDREAGGLLVAENTTLPSTSGVVPDPQIKNDWRSQARGGSTKSLVGSNAHRPPTG